MARFFNIAGPCNPDEHFMLSPARRLPDLAPLIQQRLYFVVHAPRQTGKTTAMLAFAEELRAQGVVACWATFERCQGIDDLARAEPLWMQALHEGSDALLPAQQAPEPASFADYPEGGRLSAYLRAWAARLDVPLVLLIDEADTVSGPALISLLRQLRDGYTRRAVGRFPTSVGLIGMRDLRDYVATAKGGAAVSAGSPFNIKAASVTLRNFTADEVGELLSQHTADTGQRFEAEAAASVAQMTQGQPYLVNALARHCVMTLAPDRSVAITADHVAQAREALIIARVTHLDNLAERLRDPRVARVVEAVLLGDQHEQIGYGSDDFQYVVDLGLVRDSPEGAVAANEIYREVLVRQLSEGFQRRVPAPHWPWSTPGGRLDMPALLDAFRQWWRENADVLWVPEYPEAVPHLALCAFLQRVVNGGGRIHREFAAGRGAMDLVVAYGPDRFAIEIKRVRPRDSLDRIVDGGVAQLGRYLDTLGLDHGWLMVFDVRPGKTWEERLWTREVVVDGRRVVVLGA
jgi:hypothetical protein